MDALCIKPPRSLFFSIVFKQKKRRRRWILRKFSTFQGIIFIKKIKGSATASKTHRQARGGFLEGFVAGLSGTGNVSSEEAWHMCMHKYTHTHNAGRMEALPGHTGFGPGRWHVTRNQIIC